MDVSSSLFLVFKLAGPALFLGSIKSGIGLFSTTPERVGVKRELAIAQMDCF
jgi:hypothetical protein